MKKLFVIVVLSLLCVGSVSAQKKKKVAKPKTPVIEEVVAETSPEEELYEELLPATAKVMFIDSVVVDKADFLKAMQLSPEMGKITDENGNIQFTNDFAGIRISSLMAESGKRLFMSHKYGYKWDTPTRLRELENGFSTMNYPFLCTDGVTLYFSAEGEGTLGGLDIFRTTFDAEESKFYEPANMGLPFNSSANEYLLAISDFDQIGWLVSDRHQPKGKVCIYTFEPTEQRQTFDADTEPEYIQPYADLKSIKDTWAFGDCKAAVNRKQDMIERINKKQNTQAISFVVNDDITYTQMSDFKNSSDAELYKTIEQNRSKLSQVEMLLETARSSYAEAKGTKKTQLGSNILELEKEQAELEEVIKMSEKQLRNNLNQ